MLRLSKKDKSRVAPLDNSVYMPAPGPRNPTHLSRSSLSPAKQSLVFLAHGKTLTQPRLPPLLGQVGLNGDRPPLGPSQRGVPDEVAPDPGGLLFVVDSDVVTQQADSRNRKKRAKQWQQWQDVVIPRLLQPFMDLYHSSRSLRELDGLTVRRVGCMCGDKGKTLSVSVVRFTGMGFMCH